mgnify:CR=1 FL=1
MSWNCLHSASIRILHRITISSTPFLCCVSHIVFLRAKEKMFRLHTGPHVASMQYRHSLWNRPIGNFPRMAVSADIRLATKSAVAVRSLAPLPQPAAFRIIRFFHLIPKAGIRLCKTVLEKARSGAEVSIAFFHMCSTGIKRLPTPATRLGNASHAFCCRVISPRTRFTPPTVAVSTLFGARKVSQGHVLVTTRAMFGLHRQPPHRFVGEMSGPRDVARDLPALAKRHLTPLSIAHSSLERYAYAASS